MANGKASRAGAASVQGNSSSSSSKPKKQAKPSTDSNTGNKNNKSKEDPKETTRKENGSTTRSSPPQPSPSKSSAASSSSSSSSSAAAQPAPETSPPAAETAHKSAPASSSSSLSTTARPVASASPSSSASPASSTTASATTTSPSTTASSPNRLTQVHVILIGFIVYMTVLVVYLRTLHPSVPSGDSGMLMAVAHDLGVAPPTGYPLFTLFTKASEELISYLSKGEVNPAQAMNMGHALLSSCAVLVLYMATVRLTGSISAGVLSSGLFAFCPAVWSYAVITEIFALNNFFVCILILLGVDYYSAVIRQWEDRKSATFYLTAFVGGLATTNQLTIVLYLIPMAFWALAVDWRHFSIRRLIFALLAFILGLSPYLFLIWSAHYIKSDQSWGNLRTFSGVKMHLLQKELLSMDRASKHSVWQPAFMWSASKNFFIHVRAQSLDWLWVLGVLGIAVSVIRTLGHRSLAGLYNIRVMLMSMYAFYLLFYHAFMTLPIDETTVHGYVQRYWMQQLPISFLFIADGWAYVLALVRKVKGWISGAGAKPKSSAKGKEKKDDGDKEGDDDETKTKKAGGKGGKKENKSGSAATAQSTGRFGAMFIIALSLAMALVAMQCEQQYERHDQSGNHIVRDFGKALFHSMPRYAILLTKGDMVSHPMRYLQAVENERPDVRLIDLDLLAFPWYVRRLREHYTNVSFPEGKIMYRPRHPLGFTLKDFLDLNIANHTIFYSRELRKSDDSWKTDYTTRPWGMATELMKMPFEFKTLEALEDYLIETEYISEFEQQLPNLTAAAMPRKANSTGPPVRVYGKHSWEMRAWDYHVQAISDLAAYLVNLWPGKQKDEAIKEMKGLAVEKSIALQYQLLNITSIPGQLPNPDTVYNLAVALQTQVQNMRPLKKENVPRIRETKEKFEQYVQLVKRVGGEPRVSFEKLKETIRFLDDLAYKVLYRIKE